MNLSYDRAIALRAERIEAEAWAELHSSLSPKQRTDLGIRTRRYGAALSVMSSRFDVAWLNRTLALGIDSELEPTALENVLGDYVSQHIPRWILVWSPVARPQHAIDWFTERSTRVMMTVNRWWLPLQDFELRAPRTDLRTVEIGAEALGAFRTTLAPGLGIHPELTPALSSTIGQPDWHFYLALDGERPVATAATFVDGDVAWLGIAATLGADRGRGAQISLIQRRLADCAKLNCKWATVEAVVDTTEKPSPSHRNVQRAGFRALYSQKYFLFTSGTSSP
jgi:hypothetical protein